MYKIIYDNIVIDVVEELKYAKYLKKSKHTVITDPTSANCIIGSNNQDRYHLKGLAYPDGCNLKTVSAIKIDEDEYQQLTKQLARDDSKTVSLGIRCIKRNKIAELSDICHSKIIGGTHVLLSDNRMHHFKLSLEDQINLLEINQLLSFGQDSFIYHETDGLDKEYSSNDMLRIINKLFQHKQKHLKYFNQLKNYVSNLNSIDEILNVSYDMT